MKRGRWLAPLISFFLILTCVVHLTPIPVLAGSSPAWGEYLISTYTDSTGRLIDRVIFPSKPSDIKVQIAQLPDIQVAGTANTITGVPAFDWSYGCSATAAAMLAGYYDRLGYSNLYVGPTNGGICPLDNAIWGSTTYPSVVCAECPLSASHLGIDGRTTKGSVDDYWIDYGNAGPDPYVTGSWTQHTSDCLGDFMGTNQAKYSNIDGGTTFWFNGTGAPLYDYTGSEPSSRDGCHGLRLFFESRGYTVDTNYSQYINPYKSTGFTFQQFQQEIDAGYPVLIQVTGHTMLGIGYDAATSTIYVHDTWDYSTHSMTWGGTYEGMQHYAVTVIHPHPAATAYITVTSPNGGQSWAVGSSQNITWSSTNVTGNVNIQISRDGGTSWADIVTGTANDGTQSWSVTGPASTQARIQIISVANSSIFDTSNANFTIVNAPVSSVTVTSANGGENWVIGSVYPITWTSSNLTGNVNILLSRDSGTNWETLFANTANDGTESWTVGGSTTSVALIKILSATDTGVNDTSDAVFNISDASARIIALSGDMAFGNVAVGSSLSKILTITNTGSSALTVSSIACPVGFSGNWSGSIGAGNSQSVTISFSPTSATSYSGTITVNSDKTSGINTIACSGMGMVPPPLTLISPNGGESWNAGSKQVIRWSSNNLTGYIKIELLQGGVSVKTISSRSSVSLGNYSWTISSTQSTGSNYAVRLTSTTNTSITDTSNANFTIIGPPPPSVTLIFPNGGESWNAGSTQVIRWSSVSLSGYLRIELLRGGVSVKTISARRSVSSGSYNWAIPSTQATGSNYSIRITSTSRTSITDTSNASFTINGPSITVQSPNGGENWAPGSTQVIRWSVAGVTGYVRIELIQGPTVVGTITTQTSASSGSYSWTVSSTQTPGPYSIRITSTSNSSISDMSNNTFVII
jgi:hypothetical protein